MSAKASVNYCPSKFRFPLFHSIVLNAIGETGNNVNKYYWKGWKMLKEGISQ